MKLSVTFTIVAVRNLIENDNDFYSVSLRRSSDDYRLFSLAIMLALLGVIRTVLCDR